MADVFDRGGRWAYTLRRTSDGRVLPAEFDADDVTAAGCHIIRAW